MQSVLAENPNYDPESFLKSFFLLRYMLVCIETSFLHIPVKD